MQRTTEEMEQELLALRAEIVRLGHIVYRGEAIMAALGGIEPGHFLSPYPSPKERKRSGELWGPPPARAPSGIDFRPSEQVTLLEEFARHYEEMPFAAEQTPDLRYHLGNGVFTWGDGVALYSMLRHLEPKNIIEVGVGFSSALMLDVDERFFGNQIDFTFIDPEPVRLRSLAKPGDLERIELLTIEVQDVPVSVFEQLGPGDILFIDSSHVSKAGGDVNHIFFEVLPRLAAGVYVHVHDIFYPFDYPPQWVEGKRWAWTEAYLLRAFLLYNDAFEIVFFNNYMMRFHGDLVAQHLPAMAVNPGGSIWLRVRS